LIGERTRLDATVPWNCERRTIAAVIAPTQKPHLIKQVPRGLPKRGPFLRLNHVVAARAASEPPLATSECGVGWREARAHRLHYVQ